MYMMFIMLSNSEKNAPPHLVVINKESFYIVGDRVTITCDNSSAAALLELIAVYYVFQFQYPRIYSQVLCLLQTVLTSESYTGKRSTKYKKYLPKLIASMENVRAEKCATEEEAAAASGEQ